MSEPKEATAELVWNQAELLARVDNDQELLRELVSIFKEDFPRTMESLEAAIAAADLKGASRLGHTLKGMLSSLGGTRAAAAAAKLDALASAGESAPLKDALRVLQEESARLIPEIDAYMAGVLR